MPVALACAAATALVLTLSPLRVVAAQQSSDTDSGLKFAGRLSVSTSLVIETVTVSMNYLETRYPSPLFPRPSRLGTGHHEARPLYQLLRSCLERRLGDDEPPAAR